MKMTRLAVVRVARSPMWAAEHPRRGMVRASRAQSPYPFEGIGGFWGGTAAKIIRARASIDGQNWTPWIETHGEAIAGDRAGSGLIYFGPGYRYVETDGVADPDVLLINPGPSPSPHVAKPADLAAPPVVTREQWG